MPANLGTPLHIRASSLRETLSPSRTKTKNQKPFYTHSLNTLIHQSNPLNPTHTHSPQPTPRLTHPYLSNPLCPLCNTPTYHRASIQLHTLIYLKQHTGPLDVSWEGGASAGQVEKTPGRATLPSWVVGLLHSCTGEVGRQQQQSTLKAYPSIPLC